MTTSTTRASIVTGASGGIGGAVARRLARDGFAVVLSYAGNPTRADELAGEIKASGARAISVKADVASATEVDDLFSAAIAAFGTIDVAVHAAGIMPLTPSSKASWSCSTG